jgi:hypothetical protein
VFVGVAAVFFLVGILAVLLEVQSPSFVLWNGIEVHGYTDHGLTYYHYAGKPYVIDNVHAATNDPRTSTTVWLPRKDPTDSASAYIDNAFTRWSDFAFVMSWFAVGATVLGIGFLRRHRRRQHQIEVMGKFGSGLSDHVVRDILQKRQVVRRASISEDDL